MQRQSHKEPYTLTLSHNYCVVITQNTEYHMRNGSCVAVRDRHTAKWYRDHSAVGSPMLFRVGEDTNAFRMSVRGAPTIGERLYFGPGLMTSPVTHIKWPRD